MSHSRCGTASLVGNERWFLVHTQPRSETKAELNLNAQGLRTYLPRIKRTVRHARKLKTVMTPAFPRYLFIVLDLERDRWLSVRSTVGVSRLFTHFDGSPVPVPPGIVETLIDNCDGDLTRLDAGLIKGQEVRVLSGPFADLKGKLERLDDSGRVQVLLDIMGKAIPVSIHRSVLSPAA